MSIVVGLHNETGHGADTVITYNDIDLTRTLPIQSIELEKITISEIVHGTIHLQCNELKFKMDEVIATIEASSLTKKELGIVIEELQSYYNRMESE